MNIAVIGCGYWGPNLIRNIYSIPGCKVDICCDLEIKNLTRMQQLFPGIKTTVDYKDILYSEAIDSIIIATPVHTHYKLAKEFLLANKHVLVEKPLALSSDHCLDLIRIANEMDRTLMVGHTFEYTAAVNKIKSILQNEDLGEILYISCLRLNLGLFQQDINVVWDLAPHDISIILYLLGKTPLRVNGQGKAHFFKGIDDVATATLNFDNGEIAFLHHSWLDPYKVRKMTLVGTKKMLVYDDTHPNEKIKIFDKGIDSPPQYDTYGEFQFAYRYGDIFSPRIEDKEPLRAECEHFIECIQERKTPISDGYSGLRVVTIIEAICESIQKNGVSIEIRNRHPDMIFEKKRFQNKSSG